MNRQSLGLASCLAPWLVGLVAVGCGGGSGTSPDASPRDGAAGGAAGSTSGSGGSTTTPDASAEDATPPVAGTGSHIVVAGQQITLVGSGPDSCTNDVPATGDRWCAFSKPGSTLGFNELWVIDATKAAAGVAIKCDTTDTNCLRLSSGLFDDPNSGGLTVHSFTGDTLIYEGEVNQNFGAANGFIGTFYAWRPGWSGGRAITGSSGAFCLAKAGTTSALCFENPDQSVTTQLSFELHAGALPAEGATGLPLIQSIIVQTADDAQAGVQRFQADLSNDGAYVAWSARPTATGAETLNLQKLGDATSHVVVASDVSRWAFAADGAHWYWLSSFNYDVTGSESGTLQAAAFPSGANPTAATLAMNVASFTTAGQRGLVFRSAETLGVANLSFMADTTAPTVVKALDTNVLAVVGQSDDGNETVYVKNQGSNGLTDLYVAGPTGGLPCQLAAQTVAAPTAAFISRDAIAAWARINPLTSLVEGIYTTLNACTPRNFSNVEQWTPASDEGYVYFDNSSILADGVTEVGSISYTKLANNTLPVGTLVQTQAGSTFAPLLPALPAVVYTVAIGSAADGLYINASLPFSTTAGGTDGGATDTSGTDGATDGSSDGPSDGLSTSEVTPDTGAGSDAGADAPAAE